MEFKKRSSYQYNPQDNVLVLLWDGVPSRTFEGSMAEKRFMDLLGSGFTIEIIDTDMNKKAKIRQLRALWIKQGCDQYRDSIIAPFGVTSTADLKEEDLDRLINTFSHDRKSDVPQDVREQRSLVLKLLTEMGIYHNDGDWKPVNEFLMEKKIVGKVLYQLSLEDLKKLVAKLRSIKDKYRAKDKEIHRLMNSN